MAAQHAVNLAENETQMSQAVNNIAVDVPNLVSVAQHNVLQQMLHTLQEVQQEQHAQLQALQHVQQTLQQVQQEQHAQRQMLQQLQIEFDNAAMRSLDTQLQVDSKEQVERVRNAQRQVPTAPLMSKAELQAAAGPILAPLLVHYGLPGNGGVADKRTR
jgi:hypothetical protein